MYVNSILTNRVFRHWEVNNLFLNELCDKEDQEGSNFFKPSIQIMQEGARDQPEGGIN